MLALGTLSGLYLRTNRDGAAVAMSKEETQFIQDILEAKILGSNLIFRHDWQKGDVLVLENPSLAHLAGPGSQGSLEATGLRLMHRSTVAGKVKPSKLVAEGFVPLEYFCSNHAPFDATSDEEYCLFSLKVH